MTRQQALGWCEGQLGKALDYDGIYGAQCVDFFNYYYRHVTGVNPYSHGYGVPGAKDLLGVNSPAVTIVRNNPNDPNQLPEPGDVLIYGGSMPGTGGYGHVAVVASADARTYYEQNYGGMWVRKNTRNWNGHEIGWIKLNALSAATAAQGDKPMNKEEEADAYRRMLGREMEHGGSGRTGYKFIVDGTPELNARIRVRDDAIASLKSQLASVQHALQNEQSKPPKEVVKEVEKIVERVVEVEKPVVVYTHDETLTRDVASIRGMLINFIGYVKRKLGK